MDEEDVKFVMRHPSVMIGSDGLYQGEKPHPRLFGTFARVLGKYVREEKNFKIEEAIWKMTGLPAKAFGLKERGLIKKGFFADLVLFDPQSITDKATFSEPKQHPSGIHQVLLNGELVVSNGRATSKRAGRVLRRH